MEAGGMEAAGAAEGGAEVVGMVATTADGAIGTLDTTDGTAAGDGGAAVLTLGGCFSRQSFRSHFLILTTADMATGRATATVQGTGMAGDTAGDTEKRLNCDRYIGIAGPELGAKIWELLGV
jgi:hypothetical protein